MTRAPEMQFSPLPCVRKMQLPVD